MKPPIEATTASRPRNEPSLHVGSWVRPQLDGVVQRRDRRFVVLSDICKPKPPDDLHVLLRHRLLRQPGGFEGLSMAREIAGPDGLAAAISDQLCDLGREVQPGGLTRRLHFSQGEH